MKIRRYIGSTGFVGYIAPRHNKPSFIYFDVPGDKGAYVLGVEEYTVSDSDLYKSLMKLANPETNQDFIDLYFQYIDMKYETYDYT